LGLEVEQAREKIKAHTDCSEHNRKVGGAAVLYGEGKQQDHYTSTWDQVNLILCMRGGADRNSIRFANNEER